MLAQPYLVQRDRVSCLHASKLFLEPSILSGHILARCALRGLYLVIHTVNALFFRSQRAVAKHGHVFNRIGGHGGGNIFHY